MTAKVGDWIFLATHTSTSEDLLVAEGFADDDGVILEFDPSIDVSGEPTDVSWISKFPSEREMLRAPGAFFGLALKVKSIEVTGDGQQQHVVLE